MDEPETPSGLRYVSDLVPGIRRRRAGRGFVYVRPNGSRVAADREVGRIRALAIPPAWTDVWICTDPRGHLQATGRDARGRKQYRYHPRWREYREETKFARMSGFATALPVIRERTAQDLRRPGIPRERAVAAVVDLLDRTLIRVGNEEYARENGSFGLTTLRDEHVEVDGATLRFAFRGKSGKEHIVDVHHRSLARLILRMQDLPGHHLFQYLNGDGTPHPIASDDVNLYLREIGGEEYSAKDYRTWGATVHVVEHLLNASPVDDRAEGEANVLAAIRSAAKRLGNTAPVTRRSYVHPFVVQAYLEGELAAVWKDAEGTVDGHAAGLRREEAILLKVLQLEQRRTRAA
jgi:DNA topoisomerase-1